ncbi:hypothetical protein SOVF_213750, partial [Spinacia oleracea]
MDKSGVMEKLQL